MLINNLKELINKCLIYSSTFYSKLIIFIIINSMFTVYHGIYALLGYKVMTKVDGYIVLPKEAAIVNILIGIVSSLFIVFKK